MIVVYGGGRAGIKEYLEDGKKHGRELGGRDVMDERVVLFGDLETTDRIISRMESKGERYTHITISFSERDLPVETLEAVVRRYRSLLMCAYRHAEYDFYAEAHLARLKSYTSAATGEDIERLDHVHIVIPNWNLLSGTRLTPGGYISHNLVWLNAIQEQINAEFGLVSPKERPRSTIDGADVIQRSRLDNFKAGKISRLKAHLKEKIGSHGIKNYSAFQSLLREMGEVKVINVGKANEYLALKPNGADRFINLRDPEFRRSSTRLSAASENKVGLGQPSKSERDTLIAEWTKRRAREIKYLNSGSKVYAAYREASAKRQSALLRDLERDFYQKNAIAGLQFGRQDEGPVEPQGEGNCPLNDRLRPAILETEAQSPECASPSKSKRNLSRYLERSTHYLCGQPQTVVTPEMLPAIERVADTVLGQLLHDKAKQIGLRVSEQQRNFQELKLDVDGMRMLAELAITHGILPQDYEVTHQDRGDSVRHRMSVKSYDVSRFLTEHVRMPLHQAISILQQTREKQYKLEFPPEVRTQPRRAIWIKFRKTFDLERKAKIAAWAVEKATVRQRRTELKIAYQLAKSRIQLDRELNTAQRKARLSLLAMEMVQAEDRLREELAMKRQQVNEEESLRERYRQWLRMQAQEGDEACLEELRRQRYEPRTHLYDSDPKLVPGNEEGKSVCSLDVTAIGLSYHVHLNGDVTYLRGDQEILRDVGWSLHLIDTGKKSIEMGLRLAIQKFGPAIKIDGTRAFVEKTIQVAAMCDIAVEFSNPLHDELLAMQRKAISDWRMLGTLGVGFIGQPAMVPIEGMLALPRGTQRRLGPWGRR